MDLLPYLFALLIVLGMIALLGHGLWVLMRAVFRFIFPTTSVADRPLSLHKRCVECQADLRASDEFCHVCGRWQSSAADASPLADLAMTARQLERFLAEGKLDKATHERLSQLIEGERERLTKPQMPVTPPLSEPVSQPAISAEPLRESLPAPIAAAPQPPMSELPAALAEARRASQPAVTAVSTPVAEPAFRQKREEPIVAPTEPRRSLAEILATFMEESSIRWGELIGGLLIIGCSLALVISLWSQITGALKFSVFVGMTAGLFGLGFYSAHRWKLPTSSRAVLVISTLLVPLNFLAMTAFSHLDAPASVLVIGGELLSLALFTALVFQAGKVIAPHKTWMLVGATLGPSLAMLLARHTAGGMAYKLLLGVAPLACYWASTAALLRAEAEENEKENDERDSHQLFVLFGIASFTVLLPLSLMLIKTGALWLAFRRSAVFMNLLGMPALAVGLVLWRRLSGATQGKAQTIATSIGIGGGMLALASLLFAWPAALTLLVVLLLNAVTCAVLAWRFSLRPAHGIGLAHLVLAYLVICNVLTGNLSLWNEDSAPFGTSFVSLTTGIALLSLFALLELGAEFWQRKEQTFEAWMYGIGALVAGAISFVLVTSQGFARSGDPQHVTWLYAAYAVLTFRLAWRRNQQLASWVGAALSLLAIVQGVVFKFGDMLAAYHPMRLSLLVYATLAAAAAVLLRRASARAQSLFVAPLTYAALLSSFCALPFILFGGWMQWEQMAGRLLWLAAIWLALSWQNGWPRLFTAFQGVLTASVVCGVAGWLTGEGLPSWEDLRTPLSLQAEGAALALLSLGWVLLRISARKLGWFSTNAPVGEAQNDQSKQIVPPLAARLLSPDWPTVDQLMLAVVLGVLALLSVSAALVGFADETKPGMTIQPEVRNFAAQAASTGSWFVAAAVSLALTVSLWERFRKRTVLALLGAAACASLLLAARWQAVGESIWQPAGQSITAYQWLAALGFLLLSLPILFRAQVTLLAARLAWPEMEARAKGLPALARTTVVILFAVPAVVMTWLKWLIAESQGAVFTGHVQLLSPLAILSLTLIGYAVREKVAAYAVAASLLLNWLVTLGLTLTPNPRLLRLAQWNLLISAGFALVWFALLWLQAQRAGTLPVTLAANSLLRKQINAIAVISALLLGWAQVRLVLAPDQPSNMVNGWGGLLGWASVALPFLTMAWSRGWLWNQFRAERLVGGLLLLVSLLACSVARIVPGWAAYHGLLIGWTVIPALLLAIRHYGLRVVDSARFAGPELLHWAGLLCGGATLLVLRGITAPNDVWWTCASLLVLVVLFGRLAWEAGQRGYIYAAGALGNLLVSRVFVWWTGAADLNELWKLNIIALALPALVWLPLDLRMRGKLQKQLWLPFHQFAAGVAVTMLGMFAGGQWLARSIGGNHLNLAGVLGWLALFSVAALLVACLRDEQAKAIWPQLYLTGLFACLQSLTYLPLSGRAFLLYTSTVLSVFVLLTGFAWRFRQTVQRWLALTGILPQQSASAALPTWLSLTSLGLGHLITLVNLMLVFSVPSLAQRLTVTTAALALPVGLALLAGQPPLPQMLTRSIRLGLLSLLCWSWAWCSPGDSLVVGAPVSARLVVAMIVSAGVILAYRFGVCRWLKAESLWRQALRGELWLAAGGGLLALAAVLAWETVNFLQWGNALLAGRWIAVVLLALLGLVAASLVFALVEQEDPLRLDERKRMRYVYAAEALLVITLLHVRMTLPGLFGGFLGAFWPFVVMGLAFLGVGIGELFRRRGTLVLAEPLAKTGVLLPVLPVLGFWLSSSSINYSGLLLLVGLFYGVLSVMRRSFTFGLLAALAGNSGLWHLLHRVDGYGLFEHPQLWLIPAALSVLLAARINRERLSHEQMTTIRYVTLMIVYVSSTADIFINGVTSSPWLPIVLAVLSVGGVLTGILLRIRAFLFLGTTFLLLAMVTMIWSASVNLGWEWLWSVIGIVLGVLIIYTFAIFERKRGEMLALLERLKQWQ